MPRRKRDDQFAMKHRRSRPTITIRPPFGPRANAVTARSISPASRRLIGLSSTPERRRHGLDHGPLSEPSWASPDPGRQPRASRCGAISLSSSSHFALRPYSNWMKPVALPPGRARLSTKPPPTGSTTFGEHDRHACGSPAATIGDVERRAANDHVRRERDQLRRVLAHARRYRRALQRLSIRRLRPTVQPNFCKPLQERRDVGLRFRIVRGQSMSTPMRRIRSACCARAASGHAAAAPPSSVMNSRRLMCPRGHA